MKSFYIILENYAQYCFKYRLLHGDKDETINRIVNECSKLAQKEFTVRHEWVGKMIHWELCKRLKFDYTPKWYMHNPESVWENETHKILLGFKIQKGAPNPDQETRLSFN